MKLRNSKTFWFILTEKSAIFVLAQFISSFWKGSFLHDFSEFVTLFPEKIPTVLKVVELVQMGRKTDSKNWTSQGQQINN